MRNRMDDILRRMVIRICKMSKTEVSDVFINNLMQFVKFGIVGISNTVISYALNVATLLLLRPFQVNWDYIAGNLVAFTLSVLWSFYWNNRYVFILEEGESRSLFRALLKTYISYGFTGVVLNNIMSWIWISIVEVSKYIAPMINLFVSVPLNYAINKLWAFKTRK